MGRRPSGTCTSSRWTRGRAGWARDGPSWRNRSGSSDLAEPTGSCRRAEGQRFLDAPVRIPRVRAGRPSGPVAMVSLARARRADADALGSPRGPPHAHFHRPPSRVASRGLPDLVMAGSAPTHGWIIDAYGDYDRDSMVLWLWNERGAHWIGDRRVVPTFLLHAPPSDLPAVRRRIEILDDVREVRVVSKRIALEDDEPKPVLEIVPRHYRDIRSLAHILDSNGGYVDHRLFNVDLRFSQRYAIEHDIFPMGLMHYANGVWRGGEEDLPLRPLLSAGVKAKSYFTYGKIVYKPGPYILRGRLHLDRGHFAFRESDFAGLAELSRLSTLTPQEQARLTPGTAFSAMQVNQAYHDGCLVVWKKNRPEDFKDAENLLRGDRGGFTFEPEVGVHEGLYELDFSSLYPSIMVKYNISAETLDCACCTTDGLPVPELRYHLCTRRVGIVGRVLKPLIERRRYYKKMKKEPGPLQDVYTGRDTILKWTLVTAFGYQGYSNARFGRIECHEAINAFARNILVRTMEIAESHGYEVVHGIVDSVWLRPTANADSIEKVREHIAGSIGLPIELEGRYKWIVFLPCKTTGVGALNRYYGLFQDDEFKLRGIELRKHDTPEFINICQEAMLGELSIASTAAEFRERIPKAVDILRWTAKCVLDRAIPVHQFILTKSVSRTLPEYVVLTATAAALKQMEKRGFAVEPGESVRYVLLDARARDSERKVRVAEFLQGDEEPDAWEYIRLLCRSGQTLLAPFGYTEEKLARMCEDLSDISIANIPEQAITIQEDYKSIGESRSRARGGGGYKKPWRVVDGGERPREITGGL